MISGRDPQLYRLRRDLRVLRSLSRSVRLQLHALAYNLGNFMRTLAMPKTAEPWSLTSLREKLIKIGAKVVSHGRYVTFQLAEVAVTATDVQRHSVADRPAAGTTRASMIIAGGQMRQTMTADVRLDTGKAARFRASVQATDRQSPAVRAVRCLPLLKTPRRAILGLTTAGNSGNVGNMSPRQTPLGRRCPSAEQ
jgi:hypothetical protein